MYVVIDEACQAVHWRSGPWHALMFGWCARACGPAAPPSALRARTSCCCVHNSARASCLLLRAQNRAHGRGAQGMESICVRAFAEALEVVPYTLAENAGLNPIQVRSRTTVWPGIGHDVTRK